MGNQIIPAPIDDITPTWVSDVTGFEGESLERRTDRGRHRCEQRSLSALADLASGVNTMTPGDYRADNILFDEHHLLDCMSRRFERAIDDLALVELL